MAGPTGILRSDGQHSQDVEKSSRFWPRRRRRKRRAKAAHFSHLAIKTVLSEGSHSPQNGAARPASAVRLVFSRKWAWPSRRPAKTASAAADKARKVLLLARIVDYWQRAAKGQLSRSRRESFIERATLQGSSFGRSRLSRKDAWVQSMLQADPRRRILDFFLPGDERGPLGLLRSLGEVHSGRRVSRYFSVWRPTSFDAIGQMMLGRATGKGLNVKGKSAKTGRLSGFVPYIQISEEAHKARVGTSPAAAHVRVYYTSARARAAARQQLEEVLEEMTAATDAARAALDAEVASGVALEDEEKEGWLTKLTRWGMEQPTLTPLNEGGQLGLEMPERLLWEVCVPLTRPQRDGAPELPATVTQRSTPSYAPWQRVDVWWCTDVRVPGRRT